jgi:hypothetical protein
LLQSPKTLNTHIILVVCHVDGSNGCGLISLFGGGNAMHGG